MPQVRDCISQLTVNVLDVEFVQCDVTGHHYAIYITDAPDHYTHYPNGVRLLSEIRPLTFIGPLDFF